MFLAFVDGTGLLQHGDRPAAQRADRRGLFPVISIEMSPAERNPWTMARSRRLAQGRDSEVRSLRLVHVFRSIVESEARPAATSLQPSKVWRLAAPGRLGTRFRKHCFPGESERWIKPKFSSLS